MPKNVPSTTVAAALRQIRNDLSGRFIQRQGAIQAMLLAVLSKQHCFILGPPGTGKSDLVRALVERITGAEYFEALLSKTRPDAAVLGPYDLPLLQSTGAFRRRIDGYLLTANFAFLDEVGKMGATLGHDMLAALNERLRHEVHTTSGAVASAHPIPLYTAFTASNELIVKESDDAAALWDRLLIRCIVDYISEASQFAALLRREVKPGPVTTVAFADLQHVIDVEVPAVAVPDAVIDGILQIRKALDEARISVSDRRWVQAMRVIRAHAWLEGRDKAELADLAALDCVLWSEPSQVDTVRRIRVAVADPLAKDGMDIWDQLRAVTAEIEALRHKSGGERFEFAQTAGRKRREINRKVSALAKRYHTEGVDGTEQIQQLKNAVEALEILTETVLLLGE